MHKCLKCGRTAPTLSAISEGCACGSKVFVFQRLDDGPLESSPSSITLLPLKSEPSKVSVEPDAPAPRAGAPDSSAPPTPSSDAVPPSAPVAAPPPPVPPQTGQLTLASILPSQPPDACAPNAGSSSADPRVTFLPARPQTPPAPGPAPAVASAPIPDAEEEADPSQPYNEVWLSKGGSLKPLGEGAPVSSIANPLAPVEKPDVANVRQLKSGVYEIDVGRLKGEPLVIEDSQGVYYVRLPFVPLGEAAPGERTSQDK